MNDIVERLRNGKERHEWGAHYLCEVAADEIDRLRTALREIAEVDCENDVEMDAYFMHRIAKEALGDE